ncbi:MAG: FkbM family methyltransferase, partial [Chthoniobacteraceae bacterium]
KQWRVLLVFLVLIEHQCRDKQHKMSMTTIAARLAERLSGNLRGLALILREPGFARVRRVGGDRELFRLLSRPWLDRGGIRAVIDCGANEGQAAIAFRELFPEAHIHSFEPLAEPAARLKERFSGDQRFWLHPVACGSTAGRVPFREAEFSPASSFLKACGSAPEEELPTSAQPTTIEVPVERLDAYLPDKNLPPGPWLLKLDVQGFELEVLRGAVGLFPNVSVIVCEILLAEFYEGQARLEDIFGFLRSHGFVPIDIDEPIRTPNSHKILYLDVAFAAQR